MRLDRLLPLPTPVHQPGRREGDPPRQQPDTPERHGSAEPPPPAEDKDSGGRPTAPPDHVDITV
jgi:hypothetical protein